MPPSPTAPSRDRLYSIDLVRGFVMVLMALDHVRDYFSASHFDPTDLHRTTSALFATRWITHFCAPTFVFLAGTSAGIQRQRGKSSTELGRFLLTRGLWLVLLELTLIGWSWTFALDYHFVGLQVFWALGWSMVVLAGLQFLSTTAVGVIGAAIVLFHNLLDGLHADALGVWWTIVHEQAPLFKDAHRTIFIVYPLVPWIGVMALGYASASLFMLPERERRRMLAGLGAGALALFALLRSGNYFGEHHKLFALQATPLFSFWSFLNVEKYPPSLLYVLLTVGPMLLALAALDRAKPADWNPFLVFGRVPLFYYLLHIPLIHGAQVLTSRVTGVTIPDDFFAESKFGYALPIVYAIWASVVIALYPICLWYSRIKARSKNPWLSYL